VKTTKNRIFEIKSEYIWAIAFILVVIPLMFPIGTKVEMSPMTKEIYDNIQDLPSGTIVVTGGPGVFSFMLENAPAFIACIKQMAQQELRLVNIPLGTENIPFFQYCITAAGVDEAQGGPWKYGEDYVSLPYLPGYSSGLVAFLNDVHKTIATDIKGTPLSEITLMQDVTDASSFAYWIDCSGYFVPNLARFAIGQYDLPVIGFIHAYYYAVYGPYLAMYPGQIWFTNGVIGGAQYEALMGFKGLGHSSVDAYQLISIYYYVLFILGNVVLYIQKGGEEE
jgi:hypothetical protein